MAPNYAEESREPKQDRQAGDLRLGHRPRRLLHLHLVHVRHRLGPQRLRAGGQRTSSPASIASAFYPLTDKYVGHGLTTILQLLIITSSFACAMAFYNTGARYLFALAREGVLPRSLGRVHPSATGPVVASMVVTVIVGVYMLGFTIMDPSTEAALLKLGTWTPLLGVLGILAVQGLCTRRDHPLLPHRDARRLPLVQDADRADPRLRCRWPARATC